MLIEIFDDINVETFKYIKHLTDDLPDGAEVELLIGSYGGLILNTISIIEILKRFHTKANIIGFACSAAAILALSCNTVSMGSSSSLMVHSAWGDAIESTDPGIQRCNDLQLQIIRKRCPNFQSLQSNDIWLTAEQCLDMGLVDNIYNNESQFDFVATCKKYAASLSNYLTEGCKMSKVKCAEQALEEKVIEEADKEATPEELKSEIAEEIAEPDKESKDHDLIEIIEKLSEGLKSVNERLDALEALCKPKAECIEEVKEEVPSNQDRINSLYQSIVVPQASVAIGMTNNSVKKVNKVDYKAYRQFINS